MLYGYIWILVIITLIVIVNADNRSGSKAESHSLALMQVLGAIGAVGLVIFHGVKMMDYWNMQVSTDSMMEFVIFTASSCGVAYLTYYAMFRYNHEKQRANIAEYRIHLMKKGLGVQDAIDYKNSAGSATRLEKESAEWAENAKSKPMSSYYN